MNQFKQSTEPEKRPGTAGPREACLRRIGPGFYADQERALYFHVREFLREFHLPDTPVMRAAVWEEVQRDFGVIGITALDVP